MNSSIRNSDLAPDARAEELVRVLDEYLEELKSGRNVDRRELLARHPHLAEQLEACLAGLEFIQGAAAEVARDDANHPADRRNQQIPADPEATLADVAHDAGGARPTRDDGAAANDSESHRRLGDFRILREVGRGGMGAVFEATQISLNRRVALKILRFAGVSDPQALERFQREAETVARLHHTNIVPIFAVGCDRGVHYYAMQFIEGRSLAEVLAESRRAGKGGLSSGQVAEWGLQAAEALAHAHQRGVIHRDVKPSNLMIDAERRLWLTDFGLALRADDVTLSMTGALLGTPRYMSPEQASAARQHVDQRTDVYSLGATLYELLTAEPAFSGDTPHAVINNILNSEPRPPRAVRPSVPRDFETIILKCLAKEPAQRYESARQLADDLRAFLEQRPLVARRAGIVERSVRWLRRQRRSVLLAASVTAATLLTVVVGAAGWWQYDKWRQASLTLTTNSPPLVAELLDADDNVLRIETVPTQSPIDVPRGDYKLRVSGDGVLSRTFDVQLVRGEVTKVDLDLGHTLVGAPQTIARGFATAGDGPSDRPTTGTIFEFTPTGVRAIGGTPLRTRWSTDLVAHGQKASLNLAMPPLLTTVHSGNEPFDLRPWVVSQARDLDRDGLNDYVIAARHQAWVAALSGRDGRVLWCAARSDDVMKEGPNVDQWPHSRPVSGVLDPPEWLDDIDGDGTPDLVAPFIDIVRPGVVKGSVCAARRWVEAFSGASGETIWRHELAAAPFALPAGSVVPDELHWWVGASFGESSGGASTAMFRRHYSRDLGLNQRSGLHAYRPAPLARVRHAGQARLAIVGGSFLTLLDPANGRVVDGSRALGFHASRPPQWGDLDGDGNDDLVAVVDAKQWQIMLESQRVAKLNEKLDKKLNEKPDEKLDAKLDAKPGEKPSEKPSAEPASVATPGSPDADDLLGMDIAAPTAPFATYAGTRLVAWSPSTGKLLWECDLAASIPERVNWSAPLPHWPLIVDLDGDGRCEVVTADRTSRAVGAVFRETVPWGEVVVLEGRDGGQRWSRRFASVDRQVDHFVVGPDVDGDGCRDLFVATLSGLGINMHVDACSGSDGSTLWTTSRTVKSSGPSQPNAYLAPPRFWQAGADGWPQLVVMATVDEHARQTYMTTFSAGTGRQSHSADGASDWSTRDLDGDGVDELLIYRSTFENAHGLDRGGLLSCVRGVARERWSRLNFNAQVGDDLTSDGVRDLVETGEQGTVRARDGRTGRSLWESQVSASSGRVRVVSSGADLDADGVPDLLICDDYAFSGFNHVGFGSVTREPVSPLQALSGATGRLLWGTLELEITSVRGLPIVGVRDLDGDGFGEVIFVTSCDYGYSRNVMSTGNEQLRAFVLSGRDGRLKWTQPIGPAFGQNMPADLDVRQFGELPWMTTDLDRDGIVDLLLPSVSDGVRDEQRLEWSALRGQDGRLLWRHTLPRRPIDDRFLGRISRPAVVDLDGDGRDEVVFVGPHLLEPENRWSSTRARVTALRAGDGTVAWEWTDEKLSFQGRGMMPGAPIDQFSPVVLRRGRGKAVAVALPGEPGRIVVFDGAPVARSRAALIGISDIGLMAVPAGRAATSDASGASDSESGEASGSHDIDDLLLVDGNELQRVSLDDLDAPKWRLTINGNRGVRLLGLWGSERRVVVVRCGDGDDSLLGVDLEDGTIAWRCPAPQAATWAAGATSISRAALLNVKLDAGAIPLALFQRGRMVETLQPRLTPASSLIANSAVTPRDQKTTLRGETRAIREKWERRAPARDPRWSRAVFDSHEVGRLDELALFLLQRLWAALAVWIAPIAVVTHMIRRRRWSVRMLLLLTAAVSLMLVTLFISPRPMSGAELVARIGLSAAFVPPGFLLTMLVKWTYEGRGWRVARWLAGWGVVTGLLVAAAYGMSIYHEPLGPDEWLSLEGWPFAALLAVYHVSIVALLVVPLMAALEAWRRRRAQA